MALISARLPRDIVGVVGDAKCVGLYGVIAYYVAQRTHEIGIRMALGATSSGVLGLVVGRALRLAAGGVVVGMAATLVLVRFLHSMLLGVQPFDAAVLAGASVLLTVVAMIAAWLPARRAAGIDPTVALRDKCGSFYVVAGGSTMRCRMRRPSRMAARSAGVARCRAAVIGSRAMAG